MRHRTTVVLFVLFLSGLVVLWWADYAGVPTREQQQARLNRILPELIDTQPADVRRVEIVRASGGAGGRVVVERRGEGRWQLVEPVDAAADPDLVETLVRNLKDLRKSPDSGTIEGDAAGYGLSRPEAVVSVYVGKDAKAPPLATLELGKTVRDRAYVRPGAGAGVEVVDAAMVGPLTLPAAAWRDTALFRVPTFRVESVTVTEASPPVTITLRRSDRRWRLASPVKAPADDDKAEGLVAELSSMRVAGGEGGFVADGVRGGGLAGYGLDAPAMTLAVTPFAGFGPTQTVALGGPVPGKPGEVYAKRGDQDDVVRVDFKRLREAIPGTNGLRSQTVLDVTPARVDRLRVDAPSGAFDLVKSRAGWRLLSPVEASADGSSVLTLLKDLGGLKASEFLEPGRVPDPRLDPPRFRVRGWEPDPSAASDPAAPPKGEPAFDLSVGRLDPLRKTVYGRLAGDTTVLALPESVLTVLPKNQFAFRDRTVLTLKPERFGSVTVERGRSAVTIEAPPAVGATGVNWKMVAPVRAPADNAAATAIVMALGDLRAESWEADGFGEGGGAGFGLDAPWLRVKWTLQGNAAGSPKKAAAGDSGGVLRVGKTKPGGGSYFANVEGDPRVFTLAPAVVRPFEAELHDPNVLAFRPADAGRVEIRWPSRTLLLEKLSRAASPVPTWGVAAGYDPSGFDESRVESLVASLSELKTPRFLQYTGAFPESTGLDHPRVVVTVRSRSGGAVVEQSLRVGNTLSPDALAATTAPGRDGPVFVLPTQVYQALLKPPPRPDDLPENPFVPEPPPGLVPLK